MYPKKDSRLSPIRPTTVSIRRHLREPISTPRGSHAPRSSASYVRHVRHRARETRSMVEGPAGPRLIISFTEACMHALN
jgi:hypothetical protein